VFGLIFEVSISSSLLSISFFLSFPFSSRYYPYSYVNHEIYNLLFNSNVSVWVDEFFIKGFSHLVYLEKTRISIRG
jgi:hypothetical protein